MTRVELSVAAVYGDANLHVDPRGPVLSLQRQLRRSGACDRIARLPENSEDAVTFATGFDDLSVVPRDLVEDDPIVTFQRPLCGARVGIPNPSRSLDVGHQERDRPGGQARTVTRRMYARLPDLVV